MFSIVVGFALLLTGIGFLVLAYLGVLRRKDGRRRRRSATPIPAAKSPPRAGEERPARFHRAGRGYSTSFASALAAGASGRGSSSTGAKRSPCSAAALERDLHREVARLDPVPQLLPAKRRRHRRAGLRPHRVHGRDRLAVPVLPVVDEHALALLLQPLRRQQPGMPRLEQPRRLLREVVRLLERRAARDRRDDVDPVGAARLHVARQADLVEQLADQVRHVDRLLEAVRLVRRVEVEEHEVRPVRLVDARVPRVHVDAVVLHHEEHGLRRVDEREVDEARLAFTPARMRRELSRRDPGPAGASAPASGRTPRRRCRAGTASS